MRRRLQFAIGIMAGVASHFSTGCSRDPNSVPTFCYRIELSRSLRSLLSLRVKFPLYRPPTYIPSLSPPQSGEQKGTGPDFKSRTKIEYVELT